ncbi:hypothetical protein ATK36_1004 [Amycolatopsis sulphurea]|uniref:Uncharacterized protein n=1 Tax=Amycolatopsis sulphurea TaxID=76022 RepID=A0A2A9G3I9_9PSEU|nr:hypothetical protein [Amycolatopsis sulphurea]PFG57422.1 hypothetical protein ATK36_1004 [Amycolatopsis sulphurea]
MARLRVRGWLGLALLAAVAFVFTAFVGFAAVGLDSQEKREAVHQQYDREYLNQHSQESGQFFPMHEWCNADYDVVPGWINPALVIFAVVTVACLIGAAAATVRLIRNSR